MSVSKIRKIRQATFSPMGWRQFEELIAAISAKMDPAATVEKNVKIRGVNSQRPRQVDILITFKRGAAEYKTAVECKEYTGVVGIEKIDAFVEKIKDVGADKGIMVSRAGFAKGAKASSAYHRIALMSYRQAVESDWATIFAGNPTSRLIMTKLSNCQVCILLPGMENYIEADINSVISERGHPNCRIGSIAIDYWKISDGKLGPLALEVTFDENIHGVQLEGAVESISIRSS